MQKENNTKSLALIQNQVITKVEKSIRIANKLIEEKIQNLFNEAFILLNEKQDLDPKINYYYRFESDNNLFQLEDFEFGAKCENDYLKAIKLLTEVLHIKPNHGISFLIRGFCYFDISKYSEALSDFEMTIKINPKDPYGYHWRGYSNVKLGNYQNAISDYTKAFEVDNTFYRAIHDRASAKEKLGDYASALDDFNLYIEIYSEDDWGFLNGVKLYVKINDLNGAINFCKKYQNLTENYKRCAIENESLLIKILKGN